ncbi:MAG: hypothetical protein NTV03_02170 [Candidatus Nomurabacteria bacterium]|nr:hypothetical protein [Candidatus Nomurabacteria bacterium]
MRAYIKKLQSKSEDTRKLIFVGLLILCMSFVSFIWIYNLGTRFGNPEVVNQTNEDIKPFKLFSNSISDTYKNMSASVGKFTTNKEEVKQIDLIPVETTNQ